MKALAWRCKHDLRCESVPDPRIEDRRDAIIKVTASAICGSDPHIAVFHATGKRIRDLPVRLEKLMA